MFQLQISGDSGTKYTIRQGRDGVVHCSCPAWRFQRVPAAQRSCKHVKKAALVLARQLSAAGQLR